MGEFLLELIPNRKFQKAQRLELSPHQPGGAVERADGSKYHVFCDVPYGGRLLCENPQSVEQFQLFRNDIPVPAAYHPRDGSFQIADPAFGERLFTECYGFVQLSVCFVTEQGGEYNLDTCFVPVMVRQGKQNESVKRMAEYVYQNHEILIQPSSQGSKAPSGLGEGSPRGMEARFLLLRQIAEVWEANESYFKLNSRFVTVPSEQIDRFEKLQYISPNTVQYIVRHPEELQPMAQQKGLAIRGRRYQPERTLLTSKIRSYDRAEHRAMIAFLNLLVEEISGMCAETEELLREIPTQTAGGSEYTVSARVLFSGTERRLNRARSELRELEGRFLALADSYGRLYRIEAGELLECPPPTPVFLQIPQYRQIYDSMLAWFGQGAVELSGERYMLSFSRMSELYECYVLLKMLNYLMDCGFVMKESGKKFYQFSYEARYKNTECSNFFRFQREGAAVSLYYQPVIYNNSRSRKAGIGLYRNTSLSFPRGWGGEVGSGSYYTPDYLFKFEHEGREGARYVIADAKFSTVKTVQSYEVVPLVYKYLFSVSPISGEDEVVGLCIVNGQAEEGGDRLTDIYDYSLEPGSITPRAVILTLTESEEQSDEVHWELFKEVLGRELYW